MTTTSETRTLALPDADVVFDVREPAIPSEHPPLLLIGQPMCAEGFEALATQITDRTVVTYDPRGLGRSTRSDGSRKNTPDLQSEDLHALIAELGVGPVDVFGSSGGAVTGLALVQKHPGDVRALVAHEPPIFSVIPDAEVFEQVSSAGDRAYAERGFGAGMAHFIQLIMHEGEFTQEYLDRPEPDPAQFGLPTEDDGSRDDPLLSDASKAVTAFVPDLARLQSVPTWVVIGVGETSGQIVTGRAATALAAQLGLEPVTFRGGHGGFAADEWGVPGDPAKFASQLLDALEP